MKKLSFFYLALFLIGNSVFAQDISLPAPDKKGGKPLMQALNERQSFRSYTDEGLTKQQMSDLLWAAWGINRTDQKKRTAASAMNYQEIDMYVALPTGLYLYVAESHSLKMINNKDLRKTTGTQGYVNNAALNLVFVADMGKAGKREGIKIDDSDLFMSYANAALIAQNVYLYCASAELGCIVRGSIPKEKLALEMGLKSNQYIILAQTVGHPRK
ncbi:MAG TPA: SagB/ThcOx family dehydrogenase [Bacteroidales bacterium]|nr:SagB/ThcOx family dehydrogenase [Bacteroidales bacterium]